MKKRLVTVGLAMMTAIILLIAGCGEGKITLRCLITMKHLMKRERITAP